jgi:hypothetical protein
MSDLTLATVTAADFEAVLGQSGRVTTDQATCPAVVSKVRPLRQAARWQKRDSFAVEFRVSTDHLLPQGMLRVELPGWPPLEIFCVPVQPVDGGFIYEATFA